MFLSASIFLLISATAAAVTILGFFGIVHVPSVVWWLPLFFTFIFGLTGMSHVWIGIGQVKRARHARELRESGLRGKARILNVEQTGMTINDNPQVRCVLEITALGAPVYTVTLTSVVPIIKVGLLTSPNPLPVFINPADLNDILIDW
ncbi:MAG TPA: hypothetical protein VGL53_09170 [Bryobacteraceae bacterium]|jgi:hypothetical protein